MRFRVPVTTQEPVRTITDQVTYGVRALDALRVTLPAGYQSYSFIVPAGVTRRLRSVYIQYNTTAGGATTRNALVTVQAEQTSQVSSPRTDIASYGSTAFSDNTSKFIMFVNGGGQAMTATGAFGRNEVVPIADHWLQPYDRVRIDTGNNAATDTMTVVINYEEYRLDV